MTECEAIVRPEPTLVALARDIGETFPELGGRSIAVSEIDQFSDRTNMPTLPLCAVALMGESSRQPPSGGHKIDITSDILIHFIFKPEKYTRQDGADTPFFAYYDYETIRDRLLTLTHQWRSPRNTGLGFQSMDVSSDEFAVYIAFRFTSQLKWCTDEEELPAPISIVYRRCNPKGVCVPEEEEVVDPCDFARQ